MATPTEEYRLLVRIERLRIPGLVDTMTNQAPDIARTLEGLAEKSLAEAQAMGQDGWRVASHSLGFTAGLAVLTLVLAR
jgi:hypothetical protein